MGKENTTIYVILGLLTHEDLTGYDIKKRIDSVISNFWNASYGQIYPTLKTLEQEGLVTKKTVEATKGTDKIIYSITESGKSRLGDWLSKHDEKEFFRYEILLKLFFGNTVSKEENIQRLLEFKLRSSRSLELMDQYKKSLFNALDESDDHLYYYLTVLFGEHMNKAFLNWADEAVLLLKQREAK